MKNELKANAQSAPSTLGGGIHRHLKLVMSEDEYESVEHGTPYVIPTLPKLTTETGDTQFQLVQKRNEYDTKILTYRDSIAVDCILVQQIVNSMDEKFLKALQDRTTN